MKAAQISSYLKEIKIEIIDIPVPEVHDHDVLVKVKAAGVNPLDMLILRGSVKLIVDYEFPLTMGNELSGVVEAVGKHASKIRNIIFGLCELMEISWKKLRNSWRQKTSSRLLIQPLILKMLMRHLQKWIPVIQKVR